MKSPYLAKRHWQFEEAALSKTNEMVKRYDDVIDLSIGDPDYPADKRILEAIYQAGKEGYTRYTEFLGDEDLRRATIKMYEEDQDLIEDVLVEIRQAIDMSSIYLNILSGTMDAFSSIISNNLNIVMKVLASLTLLSSIPTVVSGIYGMNVDHLPVPFFWFPITRSIVCMVVAFIILKKKDML